MVSENVYSDNSVVEFWVCGLQNFVVRVFFVIQRVQAFEEKLKHGAEIFRTWSCYKNVTEAVNDR